MTKSYTRFAVPGAALALVGGLLFLLERPAHPAGGAVAVQVTGTVATTRLDGADSQPFEQRLDVILTAGYGQSTIAVPAGKRLVIDYISGIAYVPTGAGLQFIVQTAFLGQECEARLPMTAQGPFLGEASLAASCPVKIYADPSSSVIVTGYCNNNAPNSSMTVGVYGHYVNYP